MPASPAVPDDEVDVLRPRSLTRLLSSVDNPEPDEVEDARADGFGGVALAQNVRSREEVDAIVAIAEGAGATITKPAAETFYGGYAAYFADLDGHLWEIAHNPGFTLREDGSLVLPF